MNLVEKFKKLRSRSAIAEYLSQLRDDESQLAWKTCQRADCLLDWLDALSGLPYSESHKRFVRAVLVCTNVDLQGKDNRVRQTCINAMEDYCNETTHFHSDDNMPFLSLAYLCQTIYNGADTPARQAILSRCADAIRKIYPKAP